MGAIVTAGTKSRPIRREVRVCPRVLPAIGLALFLMVLGGCTSQQDESKPPRYSLEQVPTEEILQFVDDADIDSLRVAIAQSLAYYKRLPEDRLLTLGERKIPVGELRASLVDFLALIEDNTINPQRVAARFDAFRLLDNNRSGRLLVTGYYEPILAGRLTPDADFRYPLYGVPANLLTVDLSAFNPKRFEGERLVGRLDGSRVVPYFSRAEIDHQGALQELGCELVWLRDPTEVFFLQVQGSGKIELPDGITRSIGYAAANGRPYRSIGKYLIDKGALRPEEVSLQTIREYLQRHPEAVAEVLSHNESYVFFRWTDSGPVGNLNVPLTPGRSVATDQSCYPKAALAFLNAQLPAFDENGNTIGWKPLRRFVLNQDTGGAIKGVARLDLFCGSGEAAEVIAGNLKHPGGICFLIRKSENPL